MPVLVADRVHRTYSGPVPVHAVKGVGLSLEQGDFVAIVGPSGCGKSTLLHLCGAMDRPTSGDIYLDGAHVNTLDEGALTRLRRERVGFVFQFFNLLPTLTALENVALPLLLAGRTGADAEGKADALLERVDLGRRRLHFPAELSGGEMQRVALARALVHEPAIVIADEPTGNLDSATGGQVVRLLAELNRETGVTLLLATHDPGIAAAAGGVLRMIDGELEPALSLRRAGSGATV